MTAPHKPPGLLPAVLALSALIAACPATLAQTRGEPEEERWFKVELLVFKQPSPAGSTSETWDPSPVLEYPGEMRFLIHPDAVAANLASHDATGIVDEFGRQILTLNAPPLDAWGRPMEFNEWGQALMLDAYGNPVIDEYGNPRLMDREGNALLLDEFGYPVLDAQGQALLASAETSGEEDPAELPEEAPTALAEAQPPTEAPAAPPTVPDIVPGEAQSMEADDPGILALDADPVRITPVPFTALDSGAREFAGKAAFMERRGGYEILYHESWVQPVPGESQALPIVLDRSGDTLDWPELQGSIKLYLSRFLHLETNLWLNTPGEYLRGTWRMAPPPLGPQSLIIEEPLLLPDILPEGLPESVPERVPGMVPGMVPGIVPETLPQTLPGETEAIDWWAEAADPNEPLPDEAGPIYPWRHAVLLQQKRKMRSTEVHYLDHPMFGLVALISPLTDAELEALAIQQITVPGENNPWQTD